MAKEIFTGSIRSFLALANEGAYNYNAVVKILASGEELPQLVPVSETSEETRKRIERSFDE